LGASPAPRSQAGVAGGHPRRPSTPNSSPSACATRRPIRPGRRPSRPASRSAPGRCWRTGRRGWAVALAVRLL